MCRCLPLTPCYSQWRGFLQALGAAKSQVRCSGFPETSKQHKYKRHKTFRKIIPFWSGSWKMGGPHIWHRALLLGSWIVPTTSERNLFHPVHLSLSGLKNLSSSFLWAHLFLRLFSSSIPNDFPQEKDLFHGCGKCGTESGAEGPVIIQKRQSRGQSQVLLTINPGPLTTKCSSASQALTLRSSTGVSALQLLAQGCFIPVTRVKFPTFILSKPLSLTPEVTWRTDVHPIYILGHSEESLNDVIISQCFDAPGISTPICCWALKIWKFPLPVPPPGCVHWYSPPPQCTDVTLCTEFQLVGRGVQSSCRNPLEAAGYWRAVSR